MSRQSDSITCIEVISTPPIGPACVTSLYYTSIYFLPDGPSCVAMNIEATPLDQHLRAPETSIFTTCRVPLKDDDVRVSRARSLGGGDPFGDERNMDVRYKTMFWWYVTPASLIENDRIE